MTEPVQVSEPREGTYKTRLTNNAMWVAVRIWFGQPIIGGEEQDRSPRWCCEVDGRTDRNDYDDEGNRLGTVPLDPILDDVWVHCAGHPINRNEYGFLRKRAAWARQHAPEHPAAKPHEPINLHKMEPMTP